MWVWGLTQPYKTDLKGEDCPQLIDSILVLSLVNAGHEFFSIHPVMPSTFRAWLWIWWATLFNGSRIDSVTTKLLPTYILYFGSFQRGWVDGVCSHCGWDPEEDLLCGF